MKHTAWLVVDKSGRPVRLPLGGRIVYDTMDGADKFIAAWPDAGFRRVKIEWKV